MREFFLGQLDYIFFVCAFAFLLLSLISTALHKEYKSEIPWNCLGFFGLIYGLNEWLDMLAIGLGDSVPFQWSRVTLMAISFVCLVEFGRLTCARLQYAKIGRWVHGAWLLVIISGISEGVPGVASVVRCSLGLIAGLWAGFALWRISRSGREGTGPLSLAAFAMAVYGMATALRPKAELLAMAIVDRDLFLQNVGFIAHISRTLAACIIVVTIWWYYEKLRAIRLDPEWGRRENRWAGGAILAFIALLLVGWFWTDQAGQREAAMQRIRLAQYAQQIAETMDLRLVQELSGSLSDMDSSAYATLKSKLQHVRSTASAFRFIYILRKIGGRIVYLVDSEQSASSDECLPGRAYDEAGPQLWEVFASGKSGVDSRVSHKWGGWVSAYAPLNDGRTGELVAVLGVDQGTRSFNRVVAFERLKGIIIIGIVCLSVLFAFIYWWKSALLLEQDQNEIRSDPVARWGTAGIVVLLGLTLTATLFLQLQYNAWDAFRTTFLQRAMSRAQSVSQELERQIDRLDGLRRFIASQETVQRDSFSLYVAPLFGGVPIRALEWIPRVSYDEHIFYESSARQDGLEGFQIYEKDGQGKNIPAPRRDEYFPVYYLEPLKGNEVALGYNLASEPVRRSAMEKSRDLGEPVATPPLVLVQEGKKKTGVLLFLPVYANDMPKRTVQQRHKSLKGFVLAAYNADDFFKGLYSSMPPEGLACLIEDLAASEDRRVLYRHVLKEGSVHWDHPVLRYEIPLQMPDRPWRLTLVPGTAFMERNLSKAHWWILLVGTILTVLAAVFLNFLATARNRAEILVKLRTKELNKEKEFLARSEERFRQISEGAGDCIWEVDLTGLYTYASPVIRNIYGYAPEELVGKKYFYDFYPAREKEELTRKLFAGAEKKEVFWNLIHPIVSRDGQQILLSTNAMPIVNAAGVLLGYRGVSRDITESKRAEEALRKSEERFRNIADGSGEMIWECDREGLLTYVSPLAEKIYGYRPDEIVGKKCFYEFFHPQDKERLVSQVLTEMGKKEAFRDFLSANVHRDGHKVFLLTNAMPILEEKGNLLGYRGVNRDITAAKEAEEALRKREAYLTSILDNFPYLVWLKDFDGRFLAVNSVFAKACGHAMGEIVGKNDFDVWPKALAEKYCMEDIRVIRGRIKVVTEEPILNAGVLGYFETYKSPILDREGRVIGTTGFSHDITERKKAEQAIRESEERYRQIASAITDYIYTVYIEDGKPTRTNYNQACLAVTGYAAEEFRIDPMLWIKIVVEEDRGVVKQQIDEILSGQKNVLPIEHRIVHKDGRNCWVKNTIVLHNDAQGRLLSYDGLISDITARREAEKILEDQKKALDEHAIVSRADAQGRITYVNDKFCQISQFAREELIGQDHRIINSGYHPKAFFVNLWHTISGGKVWQGNIRNKAKDGTFYWVQSTIVPIMDERGRVKEYISARTDITRNIENEERLERAMQVKTNFVSTVSHELRTPLASIKSSIDILDTEVPGQLTEDQRMFLGRVKANIDRLARLINDVLDLSKLESGKMLMNMVPLRPEELIQDVVAIHSTVAKSKGIVLETELETVLPLLVVDKDRLVQVFNNLINNALKFTKQGKVVVAASCEDKKEMLFCVQDSGDGIKEEDLPKLFQKFQQVGGASHQVSGTGLGLAICKEIVERHGGRIWVESQYGKGSAFFFSLPLRHDKRILVVDDDRVTLEIIRDVLKGTDKYEIELASDGFMAGQKYLEFAPQLIILDIGLPKLSGLEVCSRIKHDTKTMQAKIILISSFSEDTERKAWEAGADDILGKPVRPNELLSKVGNLI